MLIVQTLNFKMRILFFYFVIALWGGWPRWQFDLEGWWQECWVVLLWRWSAGRTKKIYLIFCSHVLTCGEPPFSCHTTLRRLLWFTSRPDLSSWVSVMPWWVGTFNDLLGWVRCHVVSGGWLIGSWLTPKFWVDWNLIVIQSSIVPCGQGTVGCLLL